MASSYHEQTDVETPGTDDIHIDTADLYEALGNQRRRFVVLLVDRFGRIRLGEVADRIAEFEHDPDDDRTFGDVRKAVYIGLTQGGHGEKVDGAGLVEYDDRAKVFAPSPLTGEAAGYIRDGYNRFGTFEGSAEVLA